METITYERALRALNQAVATKGHDYVYRKEEMPEGGCWNVNEDGTEPSCIVGHALAWLGVPLECMTGSVRGASIPVLDSSLTRRGIIGTSREAVDLLSEAQVNQDKGVSWGESVARAYLGTRWTNEGRVDIFDDLEFDPR